MAKFASLMALVSLVGIWLLLAKLVPMTESQPEDPYKEDRIDFVSNLGSFRLFAPRLTGGFPYAPEKTVIAKRPKVEIVRKIELKAGREAPPDALANLAITRLIGGDLSRAIPLLEEAVARSPKRKDFLTDLAAAYLIKAGGGGNFLDNMRALDLLDRATESGKPLPEALFNRALTLRRLCLDNRATQTWSRYLRSESDTGWATEARLRQKELLSSRSYSKIDRKRLEDAAKKGDKNYTNSLVINSEFSLRRIGEEETVALWADATLSQDSKRAGENLLISKAIGEALKSVTGDRLLEETVGAIRAAPRRRLQLLARGHKAYSEGRALCSQARYRECVEKLGFAKDLLEGRTPFALRVVYDIGVCDYYLSRKKVAIAIFMRVSKEARERRYLSLFGETEWMKGLVYLSNRDVAPAQSAYNISLDMFERIHERENIAGVHILIAELFDYLGEWNIAWAHRINALESLQNIADPQRNYQAFSVAAIAANKEGFPRVALYFQDEAVVWAKKMNNSLASAQAAFWKGKYELLLGLKVQAERDLFGGEFELSRLPDSAVKERTKADILLLRAKLIASDEPREAVKILTEALSLYEKGRHKTNLVEILVERAESFRRLKDINRAEEDFDSAISRMEEWRRRISSTEERIRFFDQSKQLIDSMVAFQLEDKRDATAALEYLERGRARALLDSIASKPFEPESLNSICQALPRNTLSVSYVVGRDRLLIFVLGKSGVILSKSINVDWARVRDLIAALESGVEGHAEINELKSLSAALYKIIAEPVESVASAGFHIVISADEPVSEVPFSMLWDARSGRFLVEKHLITMAPSANIYLKCLDRYGRISRAKPRRALIVSNPLFNRAQYAGLANLTGAETEGDTLKLVYPEVHQLIGSNATVGNFVGSISRADVVHFIGHAIEDRSEGSRSFLLFADDSLVANGRLTPDRIELLGLGSVRVVVLSACHALERRSSTEEGIETFARAFLVAGVPSVVGSSWRVGNSDTSKFFGAFHAALRRGADPSTSLREAQLVSLASPGDIGQAFRLCASFKIVGGTI